ncbi:MAG: hypothetical protein FWD73_04960 [Polyangiaceae bacterium]|nr:hypothetical protein [Polyangiaceae bacterium]
MHKQYLFVALLSAVGCSTPFGEAPGPDSGSGQTNGGTDSGGGRLDGGSVDPGPTFSFVQADGPAYVRQGQTISITINIARGITPGTDITINATSQPDGISVGSLTIPPGSNTGQLAITVDESVPQGALNEVVVLQGLAEGATIKVATNLSLFVIGKPGALDTAFASGGIYEDTTEYGYISTVAQQSDGKILIGACNTGYLTSQATSAVIRLNADGSVDSTLADPSMQKIPGQIYGVTAYSDGRIVTADGYNISRYTANGAPDTTFNTTGSVAMRSFSLPADWNDFYPYAVAVGQDDSIYAGGDTRIDINTNNGLFETEAYAFLQVSANGQRPDGQGSMPACLVKPTDVTNPHYITNLSLLPTGALAFAGGSFDNSSVGVGRYQDPSSCLLDEQYGINGVRYSSDWVYLNDALFETDGSVDFLTYRGTGAYSLVRIDPAGNPTAIVDLPLYAPTGITRAPDGRYLVVGGPPSGGLGSMVVAYYNYNFDWTPDTSIGKQGIVNIPIYNPLSDPRVYGMRAMPMPDGSRTVVVGSIYGGNAAGDTVEHFVVARIWN